MSEMDRLLDRVAAEHISIPARPDAKLRLTRFAETSGFEVPEDLSAFYLRFESARIGDIGTYQLLPIEAWARTGTLNGGDEWSDSEPPSWYLLCDTLNGDFVGIDLAPDAEGAHLITDIDHEAFRERRVIARSFTEFLSRALESADHRYYVHPFEPWRTLEVPYRPPSSWLRREYASFGVDPELGPETCRTTGCSRLRVRLSVLCRRHHFEAIHRQPYPFED
jgi:hypothetical protein